MSTSVARRTTPAEVPFIASMRFEDGSEMPAWVKDFTTFRKWTRAKEFPTRGRIDFIGGQVWLDMSMEELFFHNRVKGAISSVLYQLTEETEMGLFIFDRMRIVHPPTQLSVEPDAAFASQASLDSGRLKVANRPHRRGAVELVGSPDVILEVISDSSVGKDRRTLKTAYWEAGVSELWLVDVRDKRFDFQVFIHEENGYEMLRARDGWTQSPTFGREFRLVRGRILLGYPTFKLELRKP